MMRKALNTIFLFCLMVAPALLLQFCTPSAPTRLEEPKQESVTAAPTYLPRSQNDLADSF